MAEQPTNPIGKLPRWQQIAVFVFVCVLGLVVIDWAKGDSQQKNHEISTQSPSLAYFEDGSLNQTNPDNYALVYDLALHGDYQAQRNIAYGFAALPYNGQKKNKVLGCAWYLVVLNSGSPKVNAGDRSNVETYCGKLEPDLLKAAKYNAQNFLDQVNKNTNLGKLN